MTVLYVMNDSVNPDHLPVTSTAVAGYVDGIYAWSPAAWDRFATPRKIRITVEAHQDAEAFDYETGNAEAAAVAQGVWERFHSRLWSWVYTNETDCPAVHAAVAARGVPWLGPDAWPAPGAYLWCADPSGNIAAGRWDPPQRPVAVQTGGNGLMDWSNVYVELDTSPARQPDVTITTTEDHPLFVAHDSTAQYLILSTGKVHVPDPADGSALTNPPPSGAGLPYVGLTDALVASIPDAAAPATSGGTL